MIEHRSVRALALNRLVLAMERHQIRIKLCRFWMKYEIMGGGGGGGGTPINFLYRDVPTVRVSFSGSSVLTGYTISHFHVLSRVVPANLLLFSPFDRIIFAYFVRLHWNA